MNDRLPPEIQSLHHVALAVQELEPAARFYREVVGLPELPAPPGVGAAGICWFDLGQGRALHLIAGEDRHLSRAHFALTVADVAAWRAHFERLGIPTVEPRVKLYGAERVFVRDPAGNLVEFVNWSAGES